LKNPAADWLLERRPELFKKSPTTYYFVKCDPHETICEKIMRLNILPNQFYAGLAIFSAPKRGGGGLNPPPGFRLGGGLQPPPRLPAPPPLQRNNNTTVLLSFSAMTLSLWFSSIDPKVRSNLYSIINGTTSFIEKCFSLILFIDIQHQVLLAF